MYALLLILVVVYYVYYKLVTAKYWKNKNVFYEEPTFLLGNDFTKLFRENITFTLETRYKKWKDKRVIGYWSFLRPSLLVTDLELVRRILIRDFDHFVDRGINVNEDIDPLAGHLVTLQGAKWRNLRVKLTPTFTSGKMKMMFPILFECGVELQKFLDKNAGTETVLEVKELLARFTTDIIASCAFGIEAKCINNPEAEFRRYGKKFFEPGFKFIFRFLLFTFFPKIRDLFKIRTIPKDLSDFFLGVVKETMEYREKNGIERNDFMQLLIQLKNKGKLDDVDSESSLSDEKFTVNQAAAQAFVFFFAGFETSSTTLSFAFYELAFNPDIQKLLQEEIDSVLERTCGKITYEAIMEMEYLDRVVQETLRKYPPLSFLGRRCTKDYFIPELGIKIEKGIRVSVSVMGIHRDPEYFPDPEKFDPGRFLPEEKAKRNKLTALAFGEGPRNCIGSRFGLLQTKVGIVSVLSMYNLEMTKDTPVPLVFNKRAFTLSPIGGIPLKFAKRKTHFLKT